MSCRRLDIGGRKLNLKRRWSWLAREEEDRNGDGRPDRVTLFDEEERILQRDEDRNGDGVVDLRSVYSEGRLVRRELLDEELEESIEEEELASTAWSGSDEEAE